MNFKTVRPLLLVGAALVASATIAAAPARAQQKADCAIAGAGVDCEDTFGASSQAKAAAPSQATTATSSRARYDAYVADKKVQQTGLSLAMTRAADQARQGLLTACQAVSPNKPADVCP